MEPIKDNRNETVELNGDELEKVAGGKLENVESPRPDMPMTFKCLNTPECGKTFSVHSITKKCPYCGSTKIKKKSHQP